MYASVGQQMNQSINQSLNQSTNYNAVLRNPAIIPPINEPTTLQRTNPPTDQITQIFINHNIHQ